MCADSLGERRVARFGIGQPVTRKEDLRFLTGRGRYVADVDRVRYVGERVAVVIAASEVEARDAAELISVKYEILPAVISAEDAVRAGAPLVHDGAANNISFTMRLGNADTVDAAFARAHHITRLPLRNNRLTALTMEQRGCIGDYDPGTRRWTLYSSTQNVHGTRQILAHQILHVPESRIRVIARDVGGGFGMKGNVYPEEAVVLWAARRTGRPVKWMPSRSEAMLGDAQGRDQNVDAELALDSDGRFLALRWTGSHNVGAYIEGAGAIPILFSLKLASTVYDIPAVAVTSSLVFTNTSPTVPYRGAGRPEAVYIIPHVASQKIPGGTAIRPSPHPGDQEDPSGEIPGPVRARQRPRRPCIRRKNTRTRTPQSARSRRHPASLPGVTRCRRERRR